jgi:hypothetical protein
MKCHTKEVNLAFIEFHGITQTKYGSTVGS